MSRRLRARELVREAKHALFYAGPEDDADDEGGIDATDTEGPAGTYGCACVLSEPAACLVVRGGHGACTCLCHTWSDHDD